MCLIYFCPEDRDRESTAEQNAVLPAARLARVVGQGFRHVTAGLAEVPAGQTSP